MKEKIIDLSLEFTRVYRQMKDASAAMREAHAVRTLYPGLLLPPEEGDMYAGRMECHYARDLPLDLSPQGGAQVGYVMFPGRFRTLEDEYPHRRDEIEALIEFWKTESTFVKLREEAPEDVYSYLMETGIVKDDEGYMRCDDPARPRGAGFISGCADTRAAGIMVNFTRAVERGLPGLRQDVERAMAKNPGRRDFYEACLYTLKTVDLCLEDYAAKCRAAGRDDMADILCALRSAAPDSYRAAVQLVIILTILMRTCNYGRLDIALGDLMDADFRRGALDFEQAVRQTIGFYDLLDECNVIYDSRIVIGGRGRPHPEAADRFALVAMEAVRRCHRVVPVLTLRLYDGQNPALFDKALDCIGEGCIYPTLYNDDVYVPGLQKSMNLPYEDALDYVPLGCGEMTLYGKGVGSPNSTTRFLKALEAALHNGRDGADGLLIGEKTGELSELDSYEKLEAAFLDQVRAVARREIRAHEWNRERTGRDCALVLHSLLLDDCLERGASIYEGGVRYFGANTEGFGLISTANSLAVIKKLVYDEKKYTLPELVHMLDVDFEGYEGARREMLNVDKFGNDAEWVDDIKRRIEGEINAIYHDIGLKSHLHYYTVANVNPGGITIGPYVAASADGRRCGEPMSLGNSPMPGTDVSGLTAMLLSCARSPADNGGVVTNVNISRAMLNDRRETVRQAFLAYFKLGGQQLNVNCFSKGDLEDALVHPERHRNLIVRVSGYSARFTSLDAITQKNIMERTLF